MSAYCFAIEILSMETELRSLRAENARLKEENDRLWQEHVHAYLSNQTMLHNVMMKAIEAAS